MPRRDLTFEINSLTDLFSDFLSLILRLKELRDFGDPVELRRQVRQLLQSAEAKARRLDIAKPDVEDAKFAVVAFLDEVVLNSDWTYKGEWSSQPIQLEHFGTNLAGEEFFTRLDELIREKPGRPDVIEVYYLCLTLGFEGKYRVVSHDRLRGVIQDVLTRLNGLRPSPGTGLSPSWQSDDAGAGRMIGRVPVWAIPVLSFIGLILILILLDALLGSRLTELSGA